MPEAVAVTAAESGRRRSLIELHRDRGRVPGGLDRVRREHAVVLRLQDAARRRAVVVGRRRALPDDLRHHGRELARDDDQLLQVGYWAEKVAGRLFPLMSFVVLGFGIAMSANGDIGYNQFCDRLRADRVGLLGGDGDPLPRPRGEAAGRRGRRARAKSPEVQDTAAADPARSARGRGADVPDRLRHGRQALQLGRAA